MQSLTPVFYSGQLHRAIRLNWVICLRNEFPEIRLGWSHTFPLNGWEFAGCYEGLTWRKIFKTIASSANCCTAPHSQ